MLAEAASRTVLAANNSVWQLSRIVNSESSVPQPAAPPIRRHYMHCRFVLKPEHRDLKEAGIVISQSSVVVAACRKTAHAPRRALHGPNVLSLGVARRTQRNATEMAFTTGSDVIVKLSL